MSKPLIKRAELRALLLYLPKTGFFYWRRGGRRAGTLRNDGYIQICIRRRCYLAHRLAWLYAKGRWPQPDTDHINRNKADNRIENLRAVSRAENMLNTCLRIDNRSGLRGVGWAKREQRWRARIKLDGKELTLGYFKSRPMAAAASRAAHLVSAWR